MATVALTKDSFQQTLEKDGIVLIDWWAPWCGPCQWFAPTYEKVSEKHPDITFAKVNTEEEPELAASADIRGIPTLMVFRDRVPLFMHSGALPEAAVEDLIARVRSLDMDKVRAEIAEQERKQAGESAPG